MKYNFLCHANRIGHYDDIFFAPDGFGNDKNKLVNFPVYINIFITDHAPLRKEYIYFFIRKTERFYKPPIYWRIISGIKKLSFRSPDKERNGTRYVPSRQNFCINVFAKTYLVILLELNNFFYRIKAFHFLRNE